MTQGKVCLILAIVASALESSAFFRAAPIPQDFYVASVESYNTAVLQPRLVDIPELVKILNFSYMQELSCPDASRHEIMQVRLYDVPIEGSCLHHTHASAATSIT